MPWDKSCLPLHPSPSPIVLLLATSGCLLVCCVYSLVTGVSKWLPEWYFTSLHRLPPPTMLASTTRKIKQGTLNTKLNLWWKGLSVYAKGRTVNCDTVSAGMGMEGMMTRGSHWNIYLKTECGDIIAELVYPIRSNTLFLLETPLPP
jgi:hypothetical protein